MSTWLITVIIIVVIAFIIGTMTALLKQGGFNFPEGYENPEDTGFDKTNSDKTTTEDKTSKNNK